MRRVLTCSIALTLATVAATGQTPATPAVADLVQGLTRETVWNLVEAVPMKFTTYHPQGLVKIGDTLFVSSVEVKVRTRRFPQPIDGYDRDEGEGIGHLFKADLKGNLLAELTLGEGAIYHPGGIDYDGRYIWVPVTEYRPNSRSIIYRVDPSDHEGRRGISLRRFHRRHGARHGRPLPARRQLGLTPLLSLDPGRRREGHQRGSARRNGCAR